MAQRKQPPRKHVRPSRKRDAAPSTSRQAAKTSDPRKPLESPKTGEAIADTAAQEPEAPTAAKTADVKLFPIVAIGASAGGLAALEEFFSRVPRDSGLAFVVISHHSPNHESLLPELLARHADLPVANIKNGTSLAPNQIFVVPASTTLVVKDESLHVLPFETKSTAQLPIDRALRALAYAFGERVIAVILSGHGSDGTRGIAEVKHAFGMVIAQDPNTAQASSMPSSAIATHVVDYVLTPSNMPEQIQRYARSHLPARRELLRLDTSSSDGSLHKILGILRARTGNDFSAYKKSTIRRRIERRMHVHSISSAEEYARYLEQTAYEVDALFRELLISVTCFFRDEHAFEVLEHELTKLIELKNDSTPLRAWIAGCATGEEAYSIAIVFKEVLQRSGKELKLQLFATDLDQQAIDFARTGRYPESIAADLSPERLKRFFTREDAGYRVNKDVREVIIFAVQNVIKDPPFTKLDLLSCRNLLIYLESSLQKRVLSLFSYSIRPGGLLLLGTSESVSGFDDRFLALDKRWKLFQRLPSTITQPLADFFQEGPASVSAEHHTAVRDAPRASQGIAGMAERVLLKSFVPPSVIASERGETTFESSHREDETRDAKRPSKKVTASSPERINALEDELQRTRENLQGMIEELETSNEELKSTNEELQSTNEELQSTNEELETSREEMQSLNEELQTVNTELEERNRALSQANDDMQNLLNSTDVATVFLDDKLHIKRFTTQAKKVFRLIDTDIGRPISDLAANLRYDNLLSEAQEVLQTLVFREREIQTKEGAWRLMRIMPYRTHENLIDGLVITFVDIDRLKRAQRSAVQLRLYTDEIVDSIKTGILVLDSEQRVVMANRVFCAMFGIAETIPNGQPLELLARSAKDLPQLDALYDRLLHGGAEGELSVVSSRTGDANVMLAITGRRLSDHPDQPAQVLLMFDPVKAGD